MQKSIVFLYTGNKYLKLKFENQYYLQWYFLNGELPRYISGKKKLQHLYENSKIAERN